MRHVVPVSAAVLLGILSAGTASAQQTGDGADGTGWSITLGALGAVVPEYEGSDEYEFVPWPLVEVEWRDRLFLSSRRGAGGYFWNDGGLKLGGSVGYSFGRDEDDGRRLEGLGDVDGGANVNLFAEYEVYDFTLATRFTHQVTGDDTGYLVDFEVGHTFRFDRGVTVTPAVTAAYASGDYMESYFGISSSQAVRSGHPTFDADAGFKSVGPEVRVVYPVTMNLALQGSAAYERLLNDAADSPITEDADQFSLGVGVAYSF